MTILLDAVYQIVPDKKLISGFVKNLLIYLLQLTLRDDLNIYKQKWKNNSNEYNKIASIKTLEADYLSFKTEKLKRKILKDFWKNWNELKRAE